MATQLSELTIKLSADSATFDKDLQRAKDRLIEFGKSAKDAEGGGAGGGIGDWLKGIGEKAGESIEGVGGLGGELTSLALRLGPVAAAAYAAKEAIGFLYEGLKTGVEEMANYEGAIGQFDALLKATGGASGQTAEGLDELARSVAMNTLASTDGIRQAERVLLTFRSVSGDTFPQVIGLAQDMAATFGGDAASAAKQLGKAMEDPVGQSSALKESGISLTEAQKEQIKVLVESGQKWKAQQVILSEVTKEVGGSGQAQGTGLKNAVDSLHQAWGEFWETVVEKSGIYEAAKQAIVAITGAVQALDHALKSTAHIDDTMGMEAANAKAKELTGTLATLRAKAAATNDFGGEKSALNYQISQVENQLSAVQAIQKRHRDEESAAEKGRQVQAKQAAQDAADQQASAAKKAAEERAKTAASNAKQRQEAAARELEQRQRQGAELLKTVQTNAMDEQGKLLQQHQDRIKEIQSMIMDEKALRDAGFADIAAARDAALQAENDAYLAQAQKISEAESKKRQDLLDKVDKFHADSDQKERDSYDKAEQQRQKAMEDYTTFQSDRLKDFTAFMEQSGHKNNAVMKMIFAAQKLMAIPSIIVAGQQAKAGASAVAAMTGGILGVQAVSAMIDAETAMSIGLVMGQAIKGMAHDGIDSVPTEGTWLLDKGERVLTNESARKMDAVSNAILNNDNSTSSNATINQTFNFGSVTDQSLEQRIAAAARDGAEQGYQMVQHDVATRGPIRRMLNV